MSDETPTWAGPFHERQIPRGVYGQLSKVEEERQEALDALDRDHRLMYCVELSDMLGALEGVLAVRGTGVIQATERIKAKEERGGPLIKAFDRYYLLQRIGDDLAAAEAGSERTLDRLDDAVACVIRLGEAESFSFGDLWHFAKLRSDVARHALGL